MMSAEFPEIIPEPFNKPCTSYEGNTEDFINQVVIGCHSNTSMYTNGVYFSKDNDMYSQSFDNDSSHHSLLLEDPTTGQNHLLEEPPDKGTNYICEPNIHIGNSCIKIIVKEASIEDVPCKQVPENSLVINQSLDDAVQVRVEYVGESQDTILNRTTLDSLSKFMLYPKRSSSPLSSCDGCDSGGSPTPTPSYSDLITMPTIEYPGSEEKAYAVRGEEVAQLEEEYDGGTTDDRVCDEELGSSQVDSNLDFYDGPGTNEVEKSSEGFSQNMPLLLRRRSRSQSSNLHEFKTPSMLTIPSSETRKLSDPAIYVRRQRVKTTHEPQKQRCWSASEAPFISDYLDEYELKSVGEGSSAHGCDSGYHDGRIYRFHENNSIANYSSPRVSLYSDLLSQEEGPEFNTVQQRFQRVTPHPISQESGSQSDDQSSIPLSINPGTMVHSRERSRRSLLKNFSQGSLGGLSVGGASSVGASSVGASSDSPSLGSLLESQSNFTCATDILSSLGFDDFESPQLVPDRFIPKELEHLRPTSMKAIYIEQNMSQDQPKSPDSQSSGPSTFVQQRPLSLDLADLPLGATAENFLAYATNPGSPVSTNSAKPLTEDIKPHAPANPPDSVPLFTDTATLAAFTRSRVLETVPEETASDLSPSPRWLSPRVSIDHSGILDLVEGKLGASLVPKARKRSLPSNRDGYKLSIGSLVESDTGDSIHLSVTSYDDELAAEREREKDNLMPGIPDDITLGPSRRRRKGVYTPPQTLLSWLSTQNTIDEEEDADPDELPWPFNEQARLRKSLTEISLAQKTGVAISDNAGDDNLEQQTGNSQRSDRQNDHDVSLSPVSTPITRSSPQPAISERDEDELDELLNNLDDHTSELSHCYHDGLISPDIHKKFPYESPSRATVQTDTTLTRLSPSHQYMLPCATSSKPSHFGESRPPLPCFGEPTHPTPALDDSRPPQLCLSEPNHSTSTVGDSVLSLSQLDEAIVPVTNFGGNKPNENLSESRLPINCTTDSPVGSYSQDLVLPVNNHKPSTLLHNGITEVGLSETLVNAERVASSFDMYDSMPESEPNDSSVDDSGTDVTLYSPMSPYRKYRTKSQPNASGSISPTSDSSIPVLSRHRRKVPLQKQKSFDEGVMKSQNSHPRQQCRRVPVFGEAPGCTPLFIGTNEATIMECQSEIGKWMVL